MNNYSTEEIRKIVLDVLANRESKEIPVGISNRHIHLSKEDFNCLFPEEEIEPFKMLKQPGEYAAKQTLTIIGSKGEQEKVRILGPLRKNTQVEISKTDARILGIDAPIRISGDLDGAGVVSLRSEKNEIKIPAAIVAKRHIHMNKRDLARFNLSKEDVVSVKVSAAERETIFSDVMIRVGENFVLEMHIDTDEANAANVMNTTKVTLINKSIE